MADRAHPTFASSVFYKDPRAALDWLETAFGFARQIVITDPGGSVVHAQLRLGDGIVMIGPEWADFTASPGAVGGRNTQLIHVHVAADVDAHCARARAAGAVILQEPADQFYGDRIYRARDPEGHVWTIAQTVRAVTREEAEAASGLSIEGWI